MSTPYQLLLILLSPVFIVLTMKHYFLYKDIQFLWQRFFALKLPKLITNTKTNTSPLTDKPVWIHCASVGEVMTAIPLIRLILESNPSQKIILSTTTITGADAATKNLPAVTHCYLPLDYSHNIRRFIKWICPSRLIIMETEIWPNLYAVCHQHNIPIDIINGRLSKRSLDTHSSIKKLFFKSLTYVNHIYCRSDEDKKHFLSLGAKPAQLKTIGNLKFSATFDTQVDEQRVIERKYVLLASSRDNEEIEIVKLWLQAQHKDLLLVIAPRHPQRLKQIITDLSPFTANIRVRSKNQSIQTDTVVYIADTLGEMPKLFQAAEFVIMGGSFVKKGGHNLLEPANFSKAVVIGPNMDNFLAESHLLLKHDAVIQAHNETETITALNRLLSDKTYRELIGKNAHAVINNNRDIAERYLDALKLK